MADEKRRLIYELVVEAVGADKAKAATEGIEFSMKGLIGQAKNLAPALAGAFTLKAMQDAIDDMTRYEQQLAAVGVTGQAAATALAGVQTAALATGQSMEAVGGAMLEAINLQQILGRNTEYANRTTESFVAIAAAEGKTAAQAAQQLSTLAFAIDSGTLSGKEFISMLRSSNTFQRAAQEALGKTTKELVEMAKAGDLTSAQLVDVLFKMEEIGKNTSAANTTQTLTEKFKTLFATLAQGIARGARGTETKEKAPIIDPDEITQAQKLRDAADGVGVEIGGLARTAKNATDIIADGFQLSWEMITGGIDDLETSRRLTQEYTKDVRELGAAWRDVQQGFVQGTTSDPNYTDAAKDKRKKERLVSEEQARVRAENLDISRQMEKMRKELAEKDKKAAEERAAQRERERKEAAAEAKRAEAIRKRERDQFYDDQAREAEKRADEQEKQLKKDLENFGEADLQATLVEMSEVTIPGLTTTWLDNFEQMDEVTANLQDTLGGLFSGAITSADAFFASLLNGISAVFAQLAAKQAAEGIMDFLGGLFGGMNVTGASATQAGSGVGDLFRNYAAKGRAYHRGYEIPMGTGGVVSGPTVMPLAGGAGLMGEAGPEAVMPLKRTSGGRLGVSAAMPSITIVNRLGVPATARMERSNERMSVVMEAAKLGANLAESRMNRSLRTGYGGTAQSIQRTYGLRRK